MLEPTKYCSGCMQTKAGTEFHRDRSKSDGLYYRCKSCLKQYQMHWRETRIAGPTPTPPSIKLCPKCSQSKPASEYRVARARKDGLHFWCNTCEAIYRNEWLERGGGREKLTTYYKNYYVKHGERQRKQSKERYHKLRAAALQAYGGSVPKCICCGESENGFLAIDHIDGGGNQHRKEIKARSIFHWLSKNNYPCGFRILCHNCNMAIAFYGRCPHERTELSTETFR